MQPNIIGVRFTKVGKIYHFDTTAVPDVGVGEHVIVDTSRGRHLGEVVQIVKELPPRPEGGWRAVERRATPRDLLLLQTWQSKQTEAMINCRARGRLADGNLSRVMNGSVEQLVKAGVAVAERRGFR